MNMAASASTQRHNIDTGTPWEGVVGYSRAVRMGNAIYVTGTIAADETGRIIGGDDPYAQTVAAIRKIQAALQRAGADLSDVVRTRMFVTNIDDWKQIGRAHGEFFGRIRPATTMVEVSRLIVPEALVEIEADAVVAE
ncbi:MAG: RidA family protein [Phycisphaerales bacterium]|nr:RidA family protein [Phycisphaerales bacterium]MCI0630116.1 RidA family protein [Phycisphaerales bacterium]MCI0676322.1 RidA family protein [Phycisphaerales bacterium]